MRSLVGLVWFAASLLAGPFYLHDGDRVLFLGDSITQAGGYVDNIEAWLITEHPELQIDVTRFGLSSETVSGLTEPGHPYPRPNALDRIDKTIELTKPTVVVACYGMNDGIYHPFAEARFKKYQDGIRAVIKKAQAAGARVVLVTPPPFDPLLKKDLQPAGAAVYGYAKPFADYDAVLDRYGKWIMTVKGKDVMAVDLHTPMIRYTQARRRTLAKFTLAPDGVHPGDVGHWIMANAILRAWGAPAVAAVDGMPIPEDVIWTRVLRLVKERWKILAPALLAVDGHKYPTPPKGQPLEQARGKARAMLEEARAAAMGK